MLLLYLPAGCGFRSGSYERFVLFLTLRLGDFVTGLFFNNMSRMHLSDAEAGSPFFEEKKEKKTCCRMPIYMHRRVEESS